MFGGDEWLIIVIVALLIFGAGQLPKLARNLGEAQREFKRSMRDDTDEAAAGTAGTAGGADGTGDTASGSGTT